MTHERVHVRQVRDADHRGAVQHDGERAERVHEANGVQRGGRGREVVPDFEPFERAQGQRVQRAIAYVDQQGGDVAPVGAGPVEEQVLQVWQPAPDAEEGTRAFGVGDEQREAADTAGDVWR